MKELTRKWLAISLHQVTNTTFHHTAMRWRFSISTCHIFDWLGFSTCKVCVAFKDKIRKAKSKEARDRLKELRRCHCRKLRLKRLKYYDHRQKAISQPSRYLSIIIDGMDKKKIDVPFMTQKIALSAPLKQ